MSVDKVEDVSYQWHEGHPVIKIEFDPYWTPVLIDAEYADRAVIWWDCDSSEYDEAMKVYAVEECQTGRDFVSKLEHWYDVDVPRAIGYVKENLI